MLWNSDMYFQTCMLLLFPYLVHSNNCLLVCSRKTKPHCWTAVHPIAVQVVHKGTFLPAPVEMHCLLMLKGFCRICGYSVLMMLNKLARSGSETPLCVTNQQSRCKQKREREQHFASWPCVCRNRIDSDSSVGTEQCEEGMGNKGRTQVDSWQLCKLWMSFP